jgi:aryl-alcohol dehydrogenase-like predicted oxidoreductase
LTARSAQLGIGTAAFIAGYGLGPTAVPTGALVECAIASGIKYLDTAASYGDAERAIGRHASTAMAGAVRIATKIAVDAHDDAATIERAIEASRERLGMPVIDTVLAHSATGAALTSPAVAAAFAAARRRGDIERAGASTYGVADARTALAQPWCDAVQVEFSILNQSVVSAVETERRPGQEIIARSVLCKGLLTSRRQHAPELPAPLSETLKWLDRMATTVGMTLPQLAIRYALDTPAIDVVIVGVGSVEELHAALAVVDLPPLPASVFEQCRSFDRSDLDAVHPERWHTPARQ